MSTCRACGEAPPPGARYCATCGAPLSDPGPIGGAPDPLVGRTLNGRYLVQQKIGRGGMGDVYRAVHTGLETPVAVKIVKRELLLHPAMVHRFEREARAASRLRHPNIVSVTDFGRADDGTLFMVMEFVSGESLARVIADDAPLAERRVVALGAQLLAALAEAHAHDVLHRDLKPENVMIEPRRDGTEVVKVLDFGIAKVLAGPESASTLTQAGLVCGTPGYMSPEQLRGGEVDARSDLFSVGVVLYEMLTHELPHAVHTPMEMLHQHLSEPVAPPSARRGRPVSRPLEALVLAALSASRDARPPSALAMRDQLLAARPRDAGRERSRASGTLRTRPRTAAAMARAKEPPSATPPAPRTPPSVPRTPPAAWDAAVLDRACRELTPFIGPLARVIVRRTAARARDVRELYALLAREIPSEADRRRFLALAPGAR